MDKRKLEDAFNDELVGSIKAGGQASLKFISSSEKANFSKTRGGNIGDVLEQRHRQRKILFWFALSFVTITTLIVFVLIISQALLNLNMSNVRLIDSSTLQVIVTGIFVQFVSLVGIITRSIWNDKPYLDADAMRKDKRSSQNDGR